ncbi:DNA polymerase IV [Emcibacter nanhaiensis]|uniref:DNA polymerase IV n=1 Tax=Emcibacter nanhaiensis TaxID=1505037 RepID=A0A501PSE9_9PROT|nr:DNA polymerase IV [Emcibacter nanhaiensis]TPD63175.1 DNA polymerase IV [Emcibacter nanhaiensis]
MQTVCRDCFHEYERECDGPCPRCDSPRQLRHEELFGLTIAHIDCDAFYASIEKRDNPDLLSKPLIIGGGHRGVVSTACYLARGFGIHSAMPMFKANRLCPNAVVMPPNMKKYAAVSAEIREIFDQLTPLVEPLSIDEAFLDLTGTEKLHHATAAASLARAAKQIEDKIGITVSVGLSYNKFLAKMASDLNKPRGFSVIGRAEAPSFLARQPISKMWGVGKVTQAKMKRSGITTIGQLQHMGKHDLMKAYGILGERLYHFSRGEDVRIVSSESKVKSISNEITLDTDIADYQTLRKLLWPLCEKVSGRLKAKQLAGWTVTLKLKTANFRQVSRSLSLDSPTRMAETIFETGLHLLKPECQGLEYRLIGIGVGNLCSEDGADQPDLVDSGKTRKLEAEKAMDKIRGRFGSDVIKKGRNL